MTAVHILYCSPAPQKRVSLFSPISPCVCDHSARINSSISMIAFIHLYCPFVDFRTLSHYCVMWTSTSLLNASLPIRFASIFITYISSSSSQILLLSKCGIVVSSIQCIDWVEQTTKITKLTINSFILFFPPFGCSSHRPRDHRVVTVLDDKKRKLFSLSWNSWTNFFFITESRWSEKKIAVY